MADSIATAALQQLLEDRELAIQQAVSQTTSARQQAELIVRIKKQHFTKYDALLDQANHGPTWLREPRVAELIMHEIKLLAELRVEVLAYCIMSNHVHMVAQLPDLPAFSAARMMRRLKGRTALAINKLLHRQGQAFWRPESYDHVVRNPREEERVMAYVLNNPVKAGLVDDWTKWPHTYVR